MNDRELAALMPAFDMPPEKAVEFLRSQGIEQSFDWKRQAEAAQRHAFTVARVLSADALQIIRDELVRAMESGTPYSEWKKGVSKLLQSRGLERRADGSAYRWDTIFRTNLQSALMAGRDAEMMACAERFPWWEYDAVNDRRTSKDHAAIDGVVRRYDDAFWATHNPPLRYRCRCSKRSYSDAQVKRLGLTVSTGDTLVNGQGQKIPIGSVPPTPGFGRPPSEPWTPNLDKYHTAIRAKLERDLQSRSAQDLGGETGSFDDRRAVYESTMAKVEGVLEPPARLKPALFVDDPEYFNEHPGIIARYRISSGSIAINPAASDVATRSAIYHEHGHHIASRLNVGATREWSEFQQAIKETRAYRRFKDLDGEEADTYWSDPQEMWCRAMEQWLALRLVDQDVQESLKAPEYFTPDEIDGIESRLTAVLRAAKFRITR